MKGEEDEEEEESFVDPIYCLAHCHESGAE